MSTKVQAPTSTAEKLSLDTDRSGLLQRKCGCGSTAGLTGRCSECQSKPLTLQRKATQDSELNEVPPIVYDVLNSPGQPLDPETRTFMESRFKHDFSQVRVHTDQQANLSAAAANAQAYTVGRRVIFGEGAYQPKTNRGQQLIAHELAHTIQHNSNREKALPERIDSEKSVAEHEAEKAARLALSFENFPIYLTCQNQPLLSRQKKTDQDLGAYAEWIEKSPEERSRIMGSGDLPSYESIKNATYDWIIAFFQKLREAALKTLNDKVTKLSPGWQKIANWLTDVTMFSIDMMFGSILTAIGIVIGFVESIAGMLVGLVQLAYGVIKVLVDLILGVFDNFEKYHKDVNTIVIGVKNIGPGVKLIVLDWLERVKSAPREKRVLMSSELVGNVVAFLATTGFSGANASKLSIPTGIRFTEGALASGERVIGPIVVTTTIVSAAPAEAAVLTSSMMTKAASAGGGGQGTGQTGSPQKAPSEPGEWMDDIQGGTNMPKEAANYEARVCNKKKGKGYYVKSEKVKSGWVQFDGFENGTLLEAKYYPPDSRTTELLQQNADFLGNNLLEQARKQLAAAGKNPIEWRVASQEAADKIKQLFSVNKISINVRYVP